jgi:hypothetical protein
MRLVSFQPLNLSSENPVSNFAFKCNLYRYSTGQMFSVSTDRTLKVWSLDDMVGAVQVASSSPIA